MGGDGELTKEVFGVTKELVVMKSGRQAGAGKPNPVAALARTRIGLGRFEFRRKDIVDPWQHYCTFVEDDMMSWQGS